MSNWTRKLFIERADLFLKLMNQRWTLTDGLTNGMSRLLEAFGIKSSTLLDLCCCGNGRVSIFMAKKGVLINQVCTHLVHTSRVNGNAGEQKI